MGFLQTPGVLVSPADPFALFHGRSLGGDNAVHFCLAGRGAPAGFDSASRMSLLLLCPKPYAFASGNRGWCGTWAARCGFAWHQCLLAGTAP
jgi:hypothetical protein